MEKRINLSGTQLIVLSLDPDKFPDGDKDPQHNNPRWFPVTFDAQEDRHCCICGGRLTAIHFPADFSSSWRSSQELERKDESEMCAACKWFLSGKTNRQNFLPLNAFSVFLGDDLLALDAKQFYNFLRNGFDIPAVIAVLGDAKRTQKHVAWKMNRAVSPNSKCVTVSLLAVNTAKGYYDGTVTFSAKPFLALVDKIVPVAEAYRKSDRIKKISKKLWGQYYLALRGIMEQLRARGYSSEELFFAVYLACNLVFPIDERNAEKAKA